MKIIKYESSATTRPLAKKKPTAARRPKSRTSPLAMSRSAIETEIQQLKTARPTKSKVFADRRAARLAELEALLDSIQTDPKCLPTDPRLEKLLRRNKGGDHFDK